MHIFFELDRYRAQVWVINIHLTPGMAKYQPWTMVFGGSELECPQLLSATSGYGKFGGLLAVNGHEQCFLETVGGFLGA
jgi:hypothetical protein